MDTAAYLERMAYRGDLRPTPETLAELHFAHLFTVPFENLSIHVGEPIQLRLDWLFDKIVRRRRGGFCYELNGLFAALLSALGFETEMLSARVYSGDGRLGIPFDHMCLRVRAGGAAWLVDVGFGENFVRPLRLDEPGEQSDGRRSFRIEADGDARMLWDRGRRSYRFELLPHALVDFEPGSHYHQTSPESHFPRGRIVSRLTSDGRVTLTDDRLIVTDARDERREQPVTDPDEWRRLAAEQFGITDPRLIRA
jgi:N-hydroxyarylamine O-acetyltransferase